MAFSVHRCVVVIFQEGADVVVRLIARKLGSLWLQVGRHTTSFWQSLFVDHAVDAVCYTKNYAM